jgi:hypothetical protein
MAIVVKGVPSTTRRPRGRGKTRPSIREVCLVGVDGTGSVPVHGGRLSWSGRVYQVEALPASPSGGDERVRYVHLIALAEG